MIQVTREPMAIAFKEIIECKIGLEHYQEVDENRNVNAFDMNWAYFEEKERKGAAFLAVARDDEKIIGYALFTAKFAVKNKTIVSADCYAIYVKPDYRGKNVSKQIIGFCEEYCKSVGINQIYFPVRPQRNYGAMLEEIGYFVSDIIYTKHLKGE